MGRTTRNVRRIGGIDHQRCVAVWRRMYPQGTAACVAGDIGAPVRTVENWLNGVSQPNGMWLGMIIAVYGPEFLKDVMRDPPEWLVAAARREQRAALEREQREVAERLAALDAQDGGG